MARVAARENRERLDVDTFDENRFAILTDKNRSRQNMQHREFNAAAGYGGGYVDYQRQRNMTIGDLLLDNRIIFLQGEITSITANDLVMKLLYLQSVNRRKDINFYIN